MIRELIDWVWLFWMALGLVLAVITCPVWLPILILVGPAKEESCQ